MIETPLEKLARRASEKPTFLGWQLAAFARARGFDDTALAAFLECPVGKLANVRLCGPIRAEHFRADVMDVATKFGLNPHRLAEAAKVLPAEPVREPVSDEVPGAVLAARDRSEVP
jgi:hypothetical protein